MSRSLSKFTLRHSSRVTFESDSEEMAQSFSVIEPFSHFGRASKHNRDIRWPLEIDVRSCTTVTLGQAQLFVSSITCDKWRHRLAAIHLIVDPANAQRSSSFCFV